MKVTRSHRLFFRLCGMRGVSGAPGAARTLCRLSAALCVLTFSTTAQALELTGGVSVAGIQMGAKPLLAASPFASVQWRTESGLLFEVHNMLSIVPERTMGFHDRTAAGAGYAWKTGKLSVGPSLSLYSLPVCNAHICDRIVGAAPGGHVQADWFFAGPLGVSLSANVDWVAGTPRVLAEGPVVMVTAGPVLRVEVMSK